MKLNVYAAVLVAATVVTPSVWARSGADSQSTSSQTSQRSEAGSRKTGKVASVNAPAREVAFDMDAGGRKTKKLSESVVITDGKQALAIGDLKPGQAVAVTTDAKGNVTGVTVVTPS